MKIIHTISTLAFEEAACGQFSPSCAGVVFFDLMPYIDPKKRAELARRYYLNNKEKCYKASAKWRKENPDKVKSAKTKWWKENREKACEYTRTYNIRHRKRYLKSARERMQRLKSTSEGNALISCRGRLVKAVRRYSFKKAEKTSVLLGCTYGQFVAHISFQFRDGMTWNNYGRLWEIDHIRPCASFDFTKEEDQKTCFHFSNCQPLLVKENRQKKDRF